MMQRQAILCFLLLVPCIVVFGFISPSTNNGLSSSSSIRFLSSLSSAREVVYETGKPTGNGGIFEDPNIYNIGVDKAAELWIASVKADGSQNREAGMPYLDCKSKETYFVDDESLVISRDGGMGMNLIELAGGREDGYGITIVESVSGNAEKAGIVAGDSIVSVQALSSVEVVDGASSVETQEQGYDCECRDFDATIGSLTSFDDDVDSLILNIKRIRRSPRINVVVEYPPSQCGEGVDNKETVSLYAGEILLTALRNRGIVFEDRDAGQCDYCGSKCMVKIDIGSNLLNPMSTTEAKFMKNNPKCRLACKTVVGYGMQEGNIRMRINLNEWKPDEGKSTSIFAS